MNNRRDRMPVIFVAAIVGVLGLIGLGIWLYVQHEKKRSAAWEQIAMRLGAVFEVYDTSQSYFSFKLFEKGENRKMKNHMKWESDGILIHLADYQYVTYHYSTRGGRTATTHRQTVCILESAKLDLPKSFLRRSIAVIDWVAGKIGFQDIDFPEDTEFSKAFVLKGDDDIRTGQMYSMEVRMQFMQMTKEFRTFETSGNAVLFDFGKRKDPEAYSDLVARAMSVFYLLSV